VTRPLFGSRGLWPGVAASSAPPVVAWTDLAVSDISATYNNSAQTTSIADDGGGYILLSANDNGTNSDYPSRMSSVVWDLPASVSSLGPGGYGVIFRLVLDTQPAASSAFNVGIGLTDGDPNSSGTVCLIAGLRYASPSMKLYASKRHGGTADKTSSYSTPATVAELYVSPSPSSLTLNQIDVYGLDAARTTNTDATIQQQDNSVYSGPLKIMISWGRDSNTSSGSVSLRVRPQYLFWELPV